MTILREYFNQRAAIWDESIAEKDMTRLERMAKRLDIKSGSTILDVGTGTGIFLPFLLKEIGTGGRIIALDFAEKMLRNAQVKGFDGNIDYLHADVTNIPVADGIFEAVICYSSFPHFQNKPGVLAEMNRVIKKGGRLAICHTSGRASINQMHHQIPSVKNDAIPDEDEMIFMLSWAGFTEIKVEDNMDSYLASDRKNR